VIVTAVAEGLVGGGAAAAERDDVAPAQAEGLAGGVQDLQGLRSFQPEGAVFHDGDLDVGHWACLSLEDGIRTSAPEPPRRQAFPILGPPSIPGFPGLLVSLAASRRRARRYLENESPRARSPVPPSSLGFPLLPGGGDPPRRIFYLPLPHPLRPLLVQAGRAGGRGSGLVRGSRGRAVAGAVLAVGLALPAGDPPHPGLRLGSIPGVLRPHGLGRPQPHHAHGAGDRRPDAGAVLLPRLPAPLRPALRRRALRPGGSPHGDEPGHL